MRPITRRLRCLAAALGIFQAGVPGLAVAHELVAADNVAAAVHAESRGATHHASGHEHDCGVCRHLISKSRPADAQEPVAYSAIGFAACVPAESPRIRSGPASSAALPRAPPLG